MAVATHRELRGRDPAEVRAVLRRGDYTGRTAGLCSRRAQANLVVLPRDWAYDFLVFAHRNSKPCPLIDVTDPGDPVPRQVAPSADLRTDVPRYRIYRDGGLAEEVSDIASFWRSDLVAFLLGCSYTFEQALIEAGLPVRHSEIGCTVPMYITNMVL